MRILAKLGLLCVLLLAVGSCESNRVDVLSPQFDQTNGVARVVIAYDTTYFAGDTAQLHSLTQSITLTAKAYAADSTEVTGLRVRWYMADSSIATITADTAVANSYHANFTAAKNGLVKVWIVAGGGLRDALWIRVNQVAKLMQVTPTTLLMGTGTTAQLTATATDSLDQPTRIIWKTVDADVATVDNAGLVTAVATGQTNIRLIARPLSIQVPVTVRSSPLVGSVEVIPADTQIDGIGLTLGLTAVVKDTAGAVMTGVPIRWRSYRDSIATVDTSGVVTAVRHGDTRIFAYAGGLRGSSYVRVRQVVKSVSINGAPSSMQAGDTISATCTALDMNNQPIVGAPCMWRSLNTAILSVNNDTTGMFGHGSPAGLISAHAAGNTFLVAAYPLPDSTEVVDTVAISVIGALDHFLVEGAAGGNIATQTAGASFNIKITAKDAANNTVTGFSGTVSLTSNRTASAGLGITPAFTNGVLASCAITLTQSGASSTITAQDASGHAGTSNGFTVSAATAANIVKTGDTQSATVNTNVATAPAVTITDTYGNPIVGQSVSFAVVSGGGSVTGGSATTNGSGIATVTSWKLGTTSGSNSLTATAGALSATFTATGTPDVPATIAKTAGDLQNGTVGNAVTTAPAVTVTDQYGNAVPNTTVTFAVTGGGGSVTGATPTTNATGAAAVGSWTLGSGPSTNTLSASVSVGTATAQTFTAYVPPVLGADSSQAMGNTTLTSSLAPNVLSNDASINGGTLSITTTGALTTARSGTLTLASDGTFSYLPPAGNTSRDSVLYTINDGHLSSSGYIKLRFIGKVWYVDNTFAGTATGRDVSPYTSISAVEAVAGTNDTILVKTGSGTTTGGTLKSGQILRGQGHSAAFTTAINGNAATLLSTGTAPVISTLTLGSGNTLRGLRVVNPSGSGISGTSVGTLTITETAVNATGGAALDLTTGTASITLDSLKSTNSSATGITLNGVGGTVTINGGTSSTIVNPVGSAVNIGSSNPSFTFPGTISKTNGSGVGINLGGMTGGTVSFTGPSIVLSTGNSNGINMSSSSSTVSFIDSVKITTAIGTGLNATGGGTITLTGTHNSINSTNGIGLNVAGTTIGASGLTFRSIVASNAANGIVLSSTGSGSLTVTGDGTSSRSNTTRGRTTTGSATTLALGSGGIINATTSAGVSLANAGTVTLQNMTISNGAGSGITARQLSGLILDNVRVNGHAAGFGLRGDTLSKLVMVHSEFESNATNSGLESTNVWDVRLYQLTGSNDSINHSVLRDSREQIFGVENYSSSLNLYVNNSRFSKASTSGVGSTALQMIANTTANMSAAITSSQFDSIYSEGFQYAGNNSSGGGTISISNSLFNQNGIDIDIAHQGLSKTVNFTISNSTFRQSLRSDAGSGISIYLGSQANSGSALVGTISGNTIGTNGVTNSGGTSGIALHAENLGTLTAMVSNNTIRQTTQQAISTTTANTHTGRVNATYTGNDASSNTAFTDAHGLYIDSGNINGSICVNFGSNTAFIGNASGVGIGLVAAPGQILLQGYTGAQNNDAQLTSFLSTKASTVSPTPAVLYDIGAGTGVIKAAPSACAVP